MEKADFCDIQGGLIEDLDTIVNNVKKECGDKLDNSWVFDYLDKAAGNLQLINLSSDYDRNDLEKILKGVVGKKLDFIEKNIPEIKAEEVYNLINVIGDLYELLCLRTRAEVGNQRAFESEQEHEIWLARFSNNIKTIFDYVENKAGALAQKKGLRWKAKLMGAKTYLKKNLEINLNLKKLPEDISIVRESVLNNYRKYEQELIKKRY